MSDFEIMMISDAVLLAVLCILRFVFHVDGLIEFYCPAWLTRWLESGVPDLTDCDTILIGGASCNER
jgi:hypothetical protein